MIDGAEVIVPSSWEFCKNLFDKKVALICDEVGATSPPTLFFTNTKSLNKALNKERMYEDKEPLPYVENFRVDVAKQKEYKGTRKPDKPFHFKNLVAYGRTAFDSCINGNGLEADDQMCIEQYKEWKEGRLSTIICSRDKDLRQCPGLHYSWECGRQASIGPIEVDELGVLEMKNKDKVFGTGNKFFYYQLLVGDTVDNIGGVEGKGPAFAFNLLKDVESIRKAYELVAEVYVKTYRDDWKTRLKEQANLLWIIKEVKEDDQPIFWGPPKVVC